MSQEIDSVLCSDLLSLNDDCLLQLIHYLDLLSKMRLSLVNQRLRKLLLNWFRQQKAYGDTNHFRHVLCKEHKLCKSNSFKPLLDDRWPINLNKLTSLLQMSTELQCIHFNCVDDEQFIDDRLCSVLVNYAPNLTCISFGFGLQISSVGWNLIVQRLGHRLLRLHINRVRLRTLESIFNSCPNLKVLHLRCCPNVVDALRRIGSQLETLHILSKSIYLYFHTRHFGSERHGFVTFDRLRQVQLRDQIDQMNIELPEEISSGSEHDEDGPQRLNGNIMIRNRAIQTDMFRQTTMPRYYDQWFKTITELRLNRISLKTLLFIFQNLPNIKTLEIVIYLLHIPSEMEKQTVAQHASSLKNVQCLIVDLFNRWKLASLESFLTQIVSSWIHLKSITLRRVHISIAFFSHLTKCCPNLEAICLEFVDQIPFNHRFHEIDDSIVDDLILFDHLKMIRLHFTSLSDQAVKRLIRQRFAKPLQYLDLFGCVKISVNTLLELSGQLHRTNLCAKPLKHANQLQSELVEISRSNANEPGLPDWLTSEEAISTDSDDCGHHHCKYIDPYDHQCYRCNREQFLFYFSCNKTDINLRKLRFQLPNTLLFVNENDSIWNRYQ